MLCQVQASGTDSKAYKTRFAAFHTFKNGRTTLSASGILLRPSGAAAGAAAAVVTALAPLSLLYPFLQQAARAKPSSAAASSLLPGVHISVLALGPDSTLQALPATFLSALHLPATEAAAAQLLDQLNSSASSPQWKLGWHLAEEQPAESATPQLFSCWALLQLQAPPDWLLGALLREAPAPPAAAAAAAAAAAVRSISGEQQWQQQEQGQQEQQPQRLCCSSAAGTAHGSSGTCVQPFLGQPLLVQGCPFGCLAPYQFFGAAVAGWVSNTLSKLQPGGGSSSTYSLSSSQEKGGCSSSSSSSGKLPSCRGAAAAAAAAGVPSSSCPVFLVDAACHPGMEGGPIRCRCCGGLLGLLTVPLTLASNRVELLLGVRAEPLLAAAQQAAGKPPQQQQQQQQQGQAGLQQRPLQAAGPGRPGAAAAADDVAGGVAPSTTSSRHYAATSSSSSPWPGSTHHQQQQLQLGRTAAAAAAAADSPAWGSLAAPSSSSSAARCSGAVAAATAGVVMVRVGRSWATGVILSSSSGIIITNAHLFDEPSGPAAAAVGWEGGAGGSGGGSGGGAGGSAVLEGLGGWGLRPRAGLLQGSNSGGYSSGPEGSSMWDCSDSWQRPMHHGPAGGEHWPAAAAAAAWSVPTEAPNLQECSSWQQHQLQEEKQQLLTGSKCSSMPATSTSSSSSSWVYVRLSEAGAAAAGPAAAAAPWLPARLLHRFRGHLDLAVLQLLLPLPGAGRSSSNSSSSFSSFRSSWGWGQQDSLGGIGIGSSSRGEAGPHLQAAGAQQQRQQQPGSIGLQQLRPLALSAAEPVAGQEVVVLGHGLFGPRLGLDPSVTAGSLAVVVRRPPPSPPPAAAGAGPAAGAVPSSTTTTPLQHAASSSSSSSSAGRSGNEKHQHQQQQQQQPAMLITTAAVHGGASGGALVCPVTGRLLGLVTSNARHVRGATLPRLNFCIPAAELAPVWQWAQQHDEAAAAAVAAAAGGGRAAGASPAGAGVAAPGSIEALRQLDVVGDAAAAKIWGLKAPVPLGVAAGQPGGHQGPAGGGRGLGAIQSLLEGSRQQQQQQGLGLHSRL